MGPPGVMKKRKVYKAGSSSMALRDEPVLLNIVVFFFKLIYCYWSGWLLHAALVKVKHLLAAQLLLQSPKHPFNKTASTSKPGKDPSAQTQRCGTVLGDAIIPPCHYSCTFQEISGPSKILFMYPLAPCWAEPFCGKTPCQLLLVPAGLRTPAFRWRQVRPSGSDPLIRGNSFDFRWAWISSAHALNVMS